MVEHRLGKTKGAGSIPAVGSNFRICQMKIHVEVLSTGQVPLIDYTKDEFIYIEKDGKIVEGKMSEVWVPIFELNVNTIQNVLELHAEAINRNYDEVTIVANFGHPLSGILHTPRYIGLVASKSLFSAKYPSELDIAAKQPILSDGDENAKEIQE